MGTTPSTIDERVEADISHVIPDTVRILAGHMKAITVTIPINDSQFATGDGEGVILIWCSLTGRLVYSISAHKLQITSLLVMGDYLISGSADKTLKFWSLSTFEQTYAFAKHDGSVKCLHSISDDEFVSAGTDSLVIRWNLKGEIVNSIRLRTDVQCLCAISGNRERLLLGCVNGQILVWESDAKEEFSFRKIHRDSVQFIRKYSDVVFLSVSVDGLMCMWENATSVPRKLWTMNKQPTTTEHQDYRRKVRDIEIMKAGSIAAAIGNGFKVYDNRGNVFRELDDAHECWVLKLASLNEGRILVTGAVDGSIAIWRMDMGKSTKEEMLVTKFYAHTHSITGLLSITKSSFISSDESGTVMYWQSSEESNEKKREAVVGFVRSRLNFFGDAANVSPG